MTKKHEALVKEGLRKYRVQRQYDKECTKKLILQELKDSIERDLEKYLSLPHIKKLFDNKSQL